MKKLSLIILGFILLTVLLGFSLMKHDAPAVSIPAAEIHISGGSNPALLGSVPLHIHGAMGGSLNGGTK